MATTVGRGAQQTMNSVYLKPVLRKAYHKKSPDKVGEVVKLNGEEMKAKNGDGNYNDENWWIRDDRTGIYYPKGQEKIMEDVPLSAGKDFAAVNWFSQP